MEERMKKLTAIGILAVLALLTPTVSLAHQNLGTTIISVEPTAVLPGETIVVEFEYTVVNYDPPAYEISPWRIRLDGTDPYSGDLLSSGSYSHTIGNGTELTLNVVRTVTIPPATIPGPHTIWAWTSSIQFWGGSSGTLTSDSADITVVAPSQTVEVEIDIKPGSDRNPINPGSKGVTPVAILTTESFDATTVDPGTVSLAGCDVAVRGKSGKYMANKKDVDGDGDIDLLLKVETRSEDAMWESGTVELTGETFDGQEIVGYDEIVIVPPK